MLHIFVLTRRLFLWCFVGLSIIASVLKAETDFAESYSPKVFALENDHFEIIGFDSRSVSFVDQLSDHLANVGEVYFPGVNEGYPRKIGITLRPDEYADFSGASRLEAKPRGFIELDLRWNEESSLEIICRAIMDAFVTRFVYFNWGSDGVEQIHGWPVSAAGTLGYLSLRPAQLVTLTREGRSASFPQLKEILSQQSNEGNTPPLEREGYWFLMALREAGYPRDFQIELVRRSVIGENVFSILEAAIPVDPETNLMVSVDEWWFSRLRELLGLTVERYETMETSRAWISELVDFDIYRSQGYEFGNLRSLWLQRESEELREALVARSQIIRLRLDRVNPAYYNTARSLGVLYEAVLNGQRMHEFVGALTTFLTDFEDIKQTHLLVEAELQQ